MEWFGTIPHLSDRGEMLGGGRKNNANYPQLISALIREQSHNMIISVCRVSCFIRQWSWTADQAVAISPPAAPHPKYSFKTILARGEWKHICESLGSEIDVLLKLLRCPVGEKLVTLKYFFLNVFRVHKSLGKHCKNCKLCKFQAR